MTMGPWEKWRMLRRTLEWFSEVLGYGEDLIV
jgi:hypothetical protein